MSDMNVSEKLAPMTEYNNAMSVSSVPAEVDARECVELTVVRSVELSQFPQNFTVDRRMHPALGLAETSHCPGAGPQTWKALSGVEVEMSASDEWPQSEEGLDKGELTCRVGDEALTVDEVHLTAWKEAEPAGHVTHVQA